MDDRNLELASSIISTNYVNQAKQAYQQRQELIRILLSQRRLPDEGWSDSCIEGFLSDLSAMDSNNFEKNVGVGEREGRIYSPLVRSRNYGFAHGVGRSGDLAAEQPKAAGSSLLYKLVNFLALDALHVAGISRSHQALVVPVATGLALTLCFQYFSSQNPKAKYVLWPRVDQKTCFKCILSAGLEPVVIENILDGDELRTDMDALKNQIQLMGKENVLAVFSTTSCFAPRAPDSLLEISKLCKDNGLFHLVNNAYGLQSSKICHVINESLKDGGLDVFVQSTDKNFLVPVGGTVIASGKSKIVDQIAKTYPGRASSAPMVDLFITLLSMGKKGYQGLLSERKLLFKSFKEKLGNLATKHGEKLLETPNNHISIGITLTRFNNPTEVGAALFESCVSGGRVVNPTKSNTKIGNHTFVGWGSHTNGYPVAYLTFAAAIGVSENDIEVSIKRIDRILTKISKKNNNSKIQVDQPTAATSEIPSVSNVE